MIDIILWVAAFLGIAFIYGAKLIAKLLKCKSFDTSVTVFKVAGTFLCLGSVLALYLLDRLI